MASTVKSAKLIKIEAKFRSGCCCFFLGGEGFGFRARYNRSHTTAANHSTPDGIRFFFDDIGHDKYYWVSPHLTTRCYWVLVGLIEVWIGFTGFQWILLGFNGFYWVLLGFMEFYIGFTGVLQRFFWVSLGFTEFSRFSWI